MQSPIFHPRKKPRQKRSQITVDVILESATRVLRQESLAGFNTNRVAEVAGVSVGSLYQYFPNKEALVVELVSQAQNRLAESVEQAVEQLLNVGLDEAVEALAVLAVRQQYADPVFSAALDHEEKRLPLQEQMAEPNRRTVTAVHSLLSRYFQALPSYAASDCLVITKALVEADAGVLTRPPATLVNRISCALLGYLANVAGMAEKDDPPELPAPSRG
jgi:AcrR family transcriptional regulator